MKDVSSAALTPLPHLGVCIFDVAAEALQAARPLFTATLARSKRSRSTCKQRLRANITLPLLIRAVLQLHYVPGINIRRASATAFL